MFNTLGLVMIFCNLGFNFILSYAMLLLLEKISRMEKELEIFRGGNDITFKSIKVDSIDCKKIETDDVLLLKCGTLNVDGTLRVSKLRADDLKTKDRQSNNKSIFQRNNYEIKIDKQSTEEMGKDNEENYNNSKNTKNKNRNFRKKKSSKKNLINLLKV